MRTPICLLLDGIYACEGVFNICILNSWDFTTVLKPGRIPTLYKNALDKRKKYPQNKLIIESKNETETISWVQNIQYREHKLHVIFSQKTVIVNGKKIITYDTWVTNIRPKPANVEAMVKKRRKTTLENRKSGI